MLSAGLRLDRAETALVVARGRTLGSRALGLRLLATDDKPSRFAIVVPGKQVPLATRRQLLKRRVRAIIRPLTPRLRSGQNIAIFCGRETAGWSFARLEQELIGLLTQAKLLS